jgi:hypothetical protein
MQCGFVNTPAESIGHMLGKVGDMPILRFHSGIGADRLKIPDECVDGEEQVKYDVCERNARNDQHFGCEAEAAESPGHMCQGW